MSLRGRLAVTSVPGGRQVGAIIYDIFFFFLVVSGGEGRTGMGVPRVCCLSVC